MIVTNGWRGLIMLEFLQDSEKANIGLWSLMAGPGAAWHSRAARLLQDPASNARLASDPEISFNVPNLVALK